MQPDETVVFSWVHLSDIHVGQGQATDAWDQRLVLQKLAVDVPTFAKLIGIPPRAIFITGDIAYRGGARTPAGSESDEYERAIQWLEELKNSLSLDAGLVLAVPGNHDIDRSIANTDRNLRRLLSRLRSGEEDIDEALSDSGDRALLAQRFHAYIEFVARLDPARRTATPDLFWSHSLASAGVSMLILGLNSALLAADDSDRRKLRLGNLQLSQLSQARGADVTIVLTHHPINWLRDSDGASSWIRSSAHLHLCGHVHKAESLRTITGGGLDHVSVVAGAVYDATDAIAGYRYGISAIVRKANGALWIRVWPRAWSLVNKDFRLDVDNVPPGAQYAEHSLRQVESLGTTSPQSAAVPTQTSTSGKSAPASRKLYVKESDLPPQIPAWVGRVDELSVLDAEDLTVIGITGIGGQGKSALAAKYLDTHASAPGRYEAIDWRDCRERGDTLETHLVRIVERFSNGEVCGKELVQESIDSIVRTLFTVLGDQRILFVFDNVDHYVDAETAKPMHGLHFLLETALRTRHRSRFVVTCRPRDSLRLRKILPDSSSRVKCGAERATVSPSRGRYGVARGGYCGGKRADRGSSTVAQPTCHSGSQESGKPG